MGSPKVGHDGAIFTPCCVCVFYQLVSPALHFTSACFHFCSLFPGSHSSSSGWSTFGTPLFLTPLFLWLFAPCPLPLITTAFSFSSSNFQWASFFRFPFFFIKRPLPLTLHSAPLLLYRGSHLTSELPAASGPQFYSSHFFPLSGVPRPSASHPNSFLSLRFLSSQY